MIANVPPCSRNILDLRQSGYTQIMHKHAVRLYSEHAHQLHWGGTVNTAARIFASMDKPNRLSQAEARPKIRPLKKRMQGPHIEKSTGQTKTRVHNSCKCSCAYVHMQARKNSWRFTSVITSVIARACLAVGKQCADHVQASWACTHLEQMDA